MTSTQNSSANSMPNRPPPIMPPHIIEPMPRIMPPPRTEPNSRTTIAPTRAPMSIFKPSLMVYTPPSCSCVFNLSLRGAVGMTQIAHQPSSFCSSRKDAPCRGLARSGDAVEYNLNLSGMLLRSLTVRQGAGEFELDFSVLNPHPMELLKVSSGAASIELEYPTNAKTSPGCASPEEPLATSSTSVVRCCHTRRKMQLRYSAARRRLRNRFICYFAHSLLASLCPLAFRAP